MVRSRRVAERADCFGSPAPGRGSATSGGCRVGARRTASSSRWADCSCAGAGFRSPGTKPAEASAAATWCSTSVSCTVASRSLASSSLQAKGFRREGAALHGERLTNHGLGVVVGVQHDLHGDLHAALAPVADRAARARFTVQSNRSTPSSGRRAASSSRCSLNRVRSSPRLHQRGHQPWSLLFSCECAWDRGHPSTISPSLGAGYLVIRSIRSGTAAGSAPPRRRRSRGPRRRAVPPARRIEP